MSHLLSPLLSLKSAASSLILGFPGYSDGKQSPCNVGDPGSIPGSEDPLEKELATHSSILSWRIPWTEGAWWTMGWQRVGHDGATTFCDDDVIICIIVDHCVGF